MNDEDLDDLADASIDIRMAIREVEREVQNGNLSALNRMRADIVLRLLNAAGTWIDKMREDT